MPRKRSSPARMWWAAELKAGALKGYKASMSTKDRASKLNKALKTLKGNACSRLTRIQRRLHGVYNLLPRGSKARKTMERDACNISAVRSKARRQGRTCPTRLKTQWLSRSCKFKGRR